MYGKLHPVADCYGDYGISILLEHSEKAKEKFWRMFKKYIYLVW